MKLTHLRIKDFRSFSGEHGFDFSPGVNYFVGPNNCGKSNLVRALELALDPDACFDPDLDRPASWGGFGPAPTSRITLTFKVGASTPEKTLLRRAQRYELAVRENSGGAKPGRRIQTYADDGELRVAVYFKGPGAGNVTFQTKGLGAATLPQDRMEYKQLESQFRSVIRFAVVHSGEDIESLLKGKFREILHLVIADHLGEQLEKARQARTTYLTSLQKQLLDPLRTRVLEQVSSTFPEITVAELIPNVPSVDETLASVDVQLGDLATTQLTGKGTGIRGAVLVSMLHYLAEQSRRSLVLAVEEPEAFLHPGAQEDIGRQLEVLAERADVSLLVTTHSPYAISRSHESRITQLRKDAEGITHNAASVQCDDDRAELLGALYRDGGMARVLERALRIPDDARCVLVTEGYTDGMFIRIACEAAGRPELMQGVHVIPANGASKVVFQSVLTASATELPVIALVDFDDNGRSAQRQLEAFGWSKKKEIISLGIWPGRCPADHDVEIESLIPARVCERIAAKVVDDTPIVATRVCGDRVHFEYSDGWKRKALDTLADELTADDAADLVWLAEQINTRAQRIADAKAVEAEHRRAAVDQ